MVQFLEGPQREKLNVGTSYLRFSCDSMGRKIQLRQTAGL
jgi:hypothetical protein